MDEFSDSESPSLSCFALMRKFFVFSFVFPVVIYFLSIGCGALPTAFLTHEAEQHGVSSTVSGLIFGIYSLVAFMACPAIGTYLIPRFGPKAVLMCGLVVNGAAQLAFAFTIRLPKGAVFAGICFLIRAISALGAAACENSVISITIGQFRSHVPTVMSVVEMSSGLGFTVAPVLGGALFEIGGWKAPFLAVSCFLVLSVFLVWYFLRDVTEDFAESQVNLKKALKVPGVVITILVLIIGTIAYTWFNVTLDPYGKDELGLNSAEIGLLFLIPALSYALSTPVAGYVCAKTRAFRTCMIIGFLVLSAGLMMTGPAPFFTLLPQRKVWLLGVALAVSGVSCTLCFVPAMPEMLHCCYARGFPADASTDSLLSGLLTGAQNLGGFVGPVLGGALMQYFAFRWTAAIIGFVTLFQMAVLIIYGICTRQNQLDYEETRPLIIN
ncbi:MFS-type transporter SLC18B1 isoform X2 [Nematostella vectensis]|uniref:MFS-type transporter SLC18B1 isoform X2 n=1 Tax=Nematostella vectensis TaxID=45351 RepID=UPI0013905853|nr:MFS-type transporter SLC18B1 isoform X2 [Nematostella vectensis]